MPDLDIRNYKCVPLDLLRNVGTDASGEDIINVTSDAQTLKDFKEQQKKDIVAAGPSSVALSADTLENLMIGLAIAFISILLLVVIYWGFLNIRAKGLAAFSLPPEMRSFPIIAIFSILFAVFGFLLGWFIKQ
jgi:hypothetical protein